ncbi:MAG TPA: erythromycin esterase family protein [Thermoanaerobaculia bacterium]
MKRVALVLLVIALPVLARVRAVRPVPDTAAGWLRQRAIRFADLRPLVRETANAKVVAIGDATHGSHESYEARQRLTPPLVAAGFRTIALEAPYAEMARVNDYLLHGTGDPIAALRLDRYWFWDTNEVVDLIKWARAQNAAGLTPPIRIAGIDPTEPSSAAGVVIAFLRRVDPSAATNAAKSYRCLDNHYHGSSLCRSLVESVRPAIEENRARYAAVTSEAEVDELLHAARVVEQGERVLATNLAARDEMIAENVAWLVSRGERVLAFGHNEHWGRTPYVLVDPEPVRSAGMYLADVLGSGYYVIGTLLLDGTFLAVEYDPSTLVGHIKTQIMTPPSTDDYAVLFAQAGLDSMIVPMHAPLPPWLAGTHRQRIAGSAVLSRDEATLDRAADFGAKYDAVMYFRISTPTQLWHWPTI